MHQKIVYFYSHLSLINSLIFSCYCPVYVVSCLFISFRAHKTSPVVVCTAETQIIFNQSVIFRCEGKQKIVGVLPSDDRSVTWTKGDDDSRRSRSSDNKTQRDDWPLICAIRKQSLPIGPLRKQQRDEIQVYAIFRKRWWLDTLHKHYSINTCSVRPHVLVNFIRN